ncbi:MAG: zinc finger domain-containing protein, partial [Salegentibacter sp.]
EAEKKEIHKQMGKVLKMAIKEEGQRSEFPEDYLTPHRKEGEDCPKCTGKIEMIKVSGRSTYFCPKCQKEKS